MYLEIKDSISKDFSINFKQRRDQDMLMSNVQDDDTRLESNTESSNETTSYKLANTRGRGLDDDANNEDEASHQNSCFSAKEIGAVTSNDGSEECTSRKDGSNQRLIG